MAKEFCNKRHAMVVPSEQAIEEEIMRLSPSGYYRETPSGMTTQELMRHMAQFVLRNIRVAD
jgi:hypothetical protein